MSNPTSDMLKRVSVNVLKSSAAKGAADTMAAVVTKALVKLGVPKEALEDPKVKTIVKLASPALIQLTCHLAGDKIDQVAGKGVSEKLIAASTRVQEAVVTEVGFKVVDWLIPEIQSMFKGLNALDGDTSNPLSIMASDAATG